MRVFAALFFLPAVVLLAAACGTETKYTPEVPTTVEVTREVPVTVVVAREAPIAPSEENGRTIQVSRLNVVRDRGKLICASRSNLPGWAYVDAHGNSIGFDIDLCRAVAAAVLGDANAVEIRLIHASERGPAIESGEVDLLVRTTTWTAARDAVWGNFVQVMFYDGQGFLVRKDLGLNSAFELNSRRVCVVSGTTTELNLHEFSKEHGLEIDVTPFESTREVLASYQSRDCDAITNDHSQLATISSILDDPAATSVYPKR